MQLLESDDVFYLEPIFANTWNKVGKELPGKSGGDLSGTSISISANGYRFAAGAPGNTDDVNDIYDIGQARNGANSGYFYLWIRVH